MAETPDLLGIRQRSGAGNWRTSASQRHPAFNAGVERRATRPSTGFVDMGEVTRKPRKPTMVRDTSPISDFTNESERQLQARLRRQRKRGITR